MRRVVLKLGGNAVEPQVVRSLGPELAALQAAGTEVVLVHGGGAQTSALSARLGLSTTKVGGHRVTDDDTLEVVKMVVAGQVNVDLCAALFAAGAKPVGLHGASSGVVEAERRPPGVMVGGPTEPVDLGFVGEVVAVDHALLTTLLAAGYLPVLACLGASAKGDVFNINADVVAQRLAVELGADALVLVSDIGGVLEDRDDPSSRIATIDKERGRALIEAGVVTDGMVAKLEEAFVAVAQGVGRVHLLGKDAMASLRGELDAPGSVGTAFVS